MINGTKMLRKQGANPHTYHEAIVVDNNDPRKLCRIKARIKVLHDGIPDKHLPWAIPMYAHSDGAYNGERMKGDPKKWSGLMYIPKVKSKVLLKFFNGDNHYPVWFGYTVDEKTFLPESILHYPNRAVMRFQHGTYVIIDTETHEIIANNPGDIHLTNLGDMNQYVVGNHTIKVMDSKSGIPSYLLNAPDTKLFQQDLHPYANPTGKIPFEGLFGNKPPEGHQYFFVKGDQTMYIKGNRRVIIEGNDELVVKGFQVEEIQKYQVITVREDQTINVDKNQTENILKDQTFNVQQNQNFNIEKNQTFMVGDTTTIVTGGTIQLNP